MERLKEELAIRLELKVLSFDHARSLQTSRAARIRKFEE
jgi:hypothetical protein